jgi:hypothetical protein
MLLLVFPEQDEHGHAVGEQLGKRGVSWCRLSGGELGEKFRYVIDPLAEDFGVSQWSASLRRVLGEGDAAREPIQGIYWRRPIRLEQSLMESHPAAEELAGAEAITAFRLACATFPPAMFPLGHPDAIRQADNKLRQLRLATQVGFTVPETRVGNDPVALREMVARHGACVVKPLRHAAVYELERRSQTAHLLWCREFSSTVLQKHLAESQSSQMLVQQAVKKVADWRITVLPHKTICCEIDTSGLPPGEPDWRKRTMTLPHQIIEVTADFERLLRRFMDGIGLPAGYFDFAVTAEGVPYFLEMNPNAQWLWIERLTGYSISSDIADALMGAGNR